ncbi:MAG TPA: ABC transporter permease [Jatrophihabitans sp.]|jgi:ABC-2 type transport system permease protein|uniref:ABC transporter permease n=1 Tax=Jatrophihabitans sp. TaxID=1932789 RepID=UPI002DFC39CA|nr:ABC transporter permease [Jatrophihabitans sp.]
MNAALVIARKDLRQRVRDRSALVLGILAPLLIATVMSAAFGSAGSFHTTVGVVDQDRHELGAAFVAMLRSPDLSDVVTVRSVATPAEARRLVHDKKLGAAFVLPLGFTPAAHGTATARIEVLGSSDQAIAREVSAALAESFAAQVNADRLSVLTALATGTSAARTAHLIAASARLRLPVSTRSGDIGAKRLTAISYYAPSMGIFFMFFGIGFGARSYWLERRSGNLDRMLAAPVRPAEVLAGKALSTLVFGLASLLTMAVVTSVFFDAQWGPLPAAAALVFAIVLAAAALTALVAALARSERQADGVASTVTFALVLLGGNFVFVSSSPELLRRLALLTPNGWAMRGFVDLQSGAGASAAVQPVLAILAFTAVVAGAVALLARRPVSS